MYPLFKGIPLPAVDSVELSHGKPDAIISKFICVCQFSVQTPGRVLTI